MNSSLSFIWCSKSMMMSVIIMLLLQHKVVGDEMEFPTDSLRCEANREACVSITDCGEARGRESSTKICGWKGTLPLVCCSVKERLQKDDECGLSIPVFVEGHDHRFRRDVVEGGFSSLKNSRPWMVALSYRDTGEDGNFQLICGGTLIGSKFILTAAHCFDGRSHDSNNYIVHLGDNTYFPSTNGLPIASIIIHEGYKPPVLYNDIAILSLKDEIHYTNNIRAICLPDPVTIAPLLLTSVSATAAGWGRLGFFASFSSDLQEVVLPVVDNSRCNDIYAQRDLLEFRYPQGITENILCAGYDDEKKDTCQGDSGGPLFLQPPSSNRWTIIGVVSSGFRCAAGVPGIYTRVTAYSDWIQRHIRS